MNKIEDLIKQYCPNGVEYKTIEEVCEKVFAGGTPNTRRKDFYDGNIPWLRSGEVDFNEIDSTEKTITELGYKNSSAKYIRENSVLLAMTGATVARSAVNKIRLTANQSVCAMEVKDVINYKFLYYFIAHNYEKIKGMAQGALTSINLSIIKSIKVPVPPMPVQEEIVKVLDAFTALEAELEAELEARKRQYEYYRNKLLSFNENTTGGGDKIKFMQLGDVGTFIRGNGLQKKDFTDTGVGCIHYGQIYTYYGTFAERTKSYVSNELAEKLKKARTGDLIIATTSENVEDVGKAVAWLGDENICISGDAFIYHHNQNPKYMSYLFQTNSFFEQKKKCITGVKVMRINDVAMSKFKFGFPPIEEQERIVAILDKFDSLVNDISEGLPAELTARRQQYEYYRNKLLTFDEAA